MERFLIIWDKSGSLNIQNVGVFEAKDSFSAKKRACEAWGLVDSAFFQFSAIQISKIRDGWSCFV